MNVHSISEAHETITFTLSTLTRLIRPDFGICSADGAIITAVDTLISVQINDLGTNISLVEFFLDDLSVGTSYTQPWSVNIPEGWLTRAAHS